MPYQRWGIFASYRGGIRGTCGIKFSWKRRGKRGLSSRALSNGVLFQPGPAGIREGGGERGIGGKYHTPGVN